MNSLTYVIAFVDDMDAAIAFYRDVVGFKLRFGSPHWSEFDSGPTTLALHLGTPEAPAGTVKIGIGAADFEALRAKLLSANVRFTREPVIEHGVRLAEFVGPGGSLVSLSGPV